MANINPLRYRGYYYDSETGMYYLQSRYYDTSLKRFINADDAELIADLALESVLGGNIFAYCENNAVNASDPTGYWWYYFDDYYNYLYRLYHSTRYTWVYYMNIYGKYRNNHSINWKLFGNYKDYIWGQKYKYDKIKVNIKDMIYDSEYVSKAGCGVIAIYNVMKKLNKWQNFATIIDECVMNKLQCLSGYFGTRSRDIGKYFDAHNVKYKYFTNLDDFDSAAKKGKIAIMSYWRPGYPFNGIHIVSFYIKKEKNKWYWEVFNLNGKDEDVQIKKYIINIINGGKFICGYVF